MTLNCDRKGWHWLNFVMPVKLLSCCFFLFVVSACSTIKPVDPEKDSAPQHQVNWNRIKPVTPKYEKRSRYGNPVSYEQNGKRYVVLASADNHKERGVASWYGTKFHGRRTSSGETYDMMKMTAAHKTLPLPVYAKVTNLENGKQVIVKINDRGPFAKGRIIDLSYAAAHKLGMTQKGTARVEVETITFSRSGAPVKENSGDKKRYVQVGAYSVYNTAQKLAKVLDREIRLPVKITSIKRAGKKLYRVRIGPVPTQALAEELVSTLDIKALGKPKVVFD